MKLSKAQQEVMEHAYEVIDYARTHSFYDWFRKNSPYWENKEMSDEDVDKKLEERVKSGWLDGRDCEEKRYQMNRDGIDYLCHASSRTIKKLESLGLIEIIKDSNGKHYGFDVIKVLNY